MISLAHYLPKAGLAVVLIAIGLNGLAIAEETGVSPVTIDWATVRGIDQPAAPEQTGLEITYTLDGKEEQAFLPPVMDVSLWKNAETSTGKNTTLLLRDGRYSEGLIQFDFEALPKGAQITEASFRLKVGPVEKRGQPGKLSCHRILTPWTEEATWRVPSPGASDWNGLQAGKDFEAAPFAELVVEALDDKTAGGQILRIPHFEKAVQAWRDGNWANDGFLLVLNGKALQFTFASREAAGNSRDVILAGSSGGRLLLIPNAALLSRLLIKPDDLMNAQAQVTIEKAEPPLKLDSAGELQVYAVEDETHLKEARLIAEVPLKDLATGQPTLLPNVAKEMETWAREGKVNAGLVLVVKDAGTQLLLGGPTHPLAAPKLFLQLRAYPEGHLFTAPVRPGLGVYTRVVDGHLNYGGKRLRLWGVVGHPDVGRIADMGFNAERIWDPSGKVGPGKTYSDESVLRGEYQSYTKGDGSQLDLADKHFAELKARGMFVMLAALTQTIPYEPLYQDGSFIAGGDDWAEWKAAMQVPKAGNPYHYIFVDERLQKIKKQAAKNLLTHVNPYTGKAYGEEENIAVYEVYNENGFVFKMLSGDLDKWPPYFKAKMQRRWNEWLKARYTDDAALCKAWGKLEAGESLAQSTVLPAPDFQDRLKYPEARAGDYVQFMVELEDKFNQEFRSYCRSLFPTGVGVNVAPFSFDTMFRPNIPWAYTNCQGDVFSFGMYYWDPKSSLTKPPASYLIDSFTVEQKPTVLYETNIGRPDPFRAEYPIKLAAMAATQDWDGVFWHFWSRVDGEGGLPYLTARLLPPMPTFYWTAVEHQTDPVMGTSMALAGQMFLHGYLPPAEKPKTVKLGEKAVLSYAGFRGINLAPSTFHEGSKLQFDVADQKASTAALVPATARLTHAVASGKSIIWDWPKGRLIIDAPNVKAYVGPPDGSFRFSDGITLGAVSSPWVAFVMESADGKPLTGPEATSRILMGAVADAKNIGFSFNYDVVGGPTEQAKVVKDVGRLPVVVDQVNYTVWFPRQFKGTLKTYDFALRETRSTDIAGGSNQVVQQGPTPFMNLLQVESWGEPGNLPVAAATPIEVEAEKASATPTGDAAASELKSADLVHPVPGMDWNMDYVTARKYVENSPLAFTTFSDFDGSANPDKLLTVSDLQLPAFWNSPADVKVSFHLDHMSEVEVTLKAPPPVEEMVARFSALLGLPAEKKLDTQYGTTRVVWKGKDASPDVTITESQGILKVLFQPHLPDVK